jgi:hypothetical protein
MRCTERYPPRERTVKRDLLDTPTLRRPLENGRVTWERLAANKQPKLVTLYGFTNFALCAAE